MGGQEEFMRLSNLTQLNSIPSRRHGKESIASVLSQFLPPDLKAPERPTIPAPSCGTLPPRIPGLDELLGVAKRISRG
jgi:hypothetical protein